MAPKNKKPHNKTAMLSQALADVTVNPAMSQQKSKPFMSGNICPALNPELLNQMANSASNNIDYIEDDDDDDDSNALDSDEDFDEEACLHCQNTSLLVQVRCDECNSYICNQCHWCHEYQSNHEIRVCDRCDAFYCRACDEMDQCDDCGEVVCGTCSTLLSCKFCGGGLCEDCATACGRYVVYDYIFKCIAVECDLTGTRSFCFSQLFSFSPHPTQQLTAISPSQLIGAALSSVKATLSLLWNAILVAYHTVWCVWQAEIKILVYGVVTAPRSGWNSSCICD